MKEPLDDSKRIQAGLEADRIHLVALREELKADQLAVANLEAKMAEIREAILLIQDKIGGMEKKLAFLKREESRRMKK